MRRVISPLLLGFIGAIASPSTLTAAPADVQISGFVTAAYSQLNRASPSYMNRINNEGDWGDTHFGLNAHATMSDGWTVAGQLFASGTETTERYNLTLDWAYITKQFTDNVSASAGKIKYPNLIASEYVDVGIAYPWIRPPEELYRYDTSGVNLSLESFEGASLNFRTSMTMDFSAQIYAGQASAEDGDLRHMSGVKAAVGTDDFTIQTAHNRHTLRLMNTSERYDALNSEKASVTSAGLQFDKANIVGYAEFARGKAADITTKAHYGTLGYRFGKYMPHITAAKVSQGEWGQKSTTLGLKYQMSAATDFKIEVKRIKPTAEDGEETYGLFEEGGGEPESGSARLISVAVDAVF